MGDRGRRWRREDGQASVELVASLPFVLLLAALLWQCALVGHTAWLAAHAARAGARAEAVDGDARAAARSTLPRALERGLEVERERGRVTVRVPMPLLVHGWRAPVAIGASAALEGG